MKKILFIILAFTLFFACEDSKEILSQPISGNWKVLSLDDKDATKFNATLLIKAPQKESNGTSGCNFFSANTTVDSVKLTIDFDPVITTKIGCMTDLAIFEQNYYNALSVIDSYEFDNQILILKDKSGKRLKLQK